MKSAHVFVDNYYYCRRPLSAVYQAERRDEAKKLIYLIYTDLTILRQITCCTECIQLSN